jgi:hypothetical protein
MSVQQQESASDRRNSDPLVAEMRMLRQSLDRKHPENVGHMKKMEDKIDLMDSKVDQVLAGFPEGDPEGHRRAHDAMIKKAEESTKFWRELRVKLAEKGVWAVLMFISGALYWYLMDRMKR